MDRKRELKQQYKETPVEAGVFQILNQQNNKIYIGRTKNLKTLNGIKFMLENNGFTTSKALQTEWNQYWKDAFTFKLLEKLKKNDDPFALKKKLWMSWKKSGWRNCSRMEIGGIIRSRYGYHNTISHEKRSEFFISEHSTFSRQNKGLPKLG